MNHKRRRPKNRRGGCLYCKPHLREARLRPPGDGRRRRPRPPASEISTEALDRLAGQSTQGHTVAAPQGTAHRSGPALTVTGVVESLLRCLLGGRCAGRGVEAVHREPTHTARTSTESDSLGIAPRTGVVPSAPVRITNTRGASLSSCNPCRSMRFSAASFSAHGRAPSRFMLSVI